MPKFDAAMVERLRAGDFFIPPDEFRDLATKQRGSFRITQILVAALTEGEPWQRRAAVGAITTLFVALAGDDEGADARAHRRANGYAVSTVEVVAMWREIARHRERDDDVP